jgi:hypothetical protein
MSAFLSSGFQGSRIGAVEQETAFPTVYVQFFAMAKAEPSEKLTLRCPCVKFILTAQDRLKPSKGWSEVA